MKARHVLAVFAGSAISLILTLVFSVILGVVFIVYYTSTGMDVHAAAKQMDFAHLTQSVPLLLSTIGIGGFAMLVGGFIAGWIGRTAHVLTGLGTGILSTLVSIPFFFWYPLWYDLVCVVATIGPAAMGGYVARIFVGPRAAAPATQP